MNYTINEIPDTAEEANNTDYAIMWQGKTKKISILNLFKKLVKKSEVTNTISAINENPITSKAVSSLLTISASTTTITNAPPLQNGTTLRIFFTSEIAGTDDTTVLQISYNGTSYNVKVPKDGALQNYVAFEVSSGVFKYLQAYTTLELLFDGTQFVIIGNPVVISNSDYVFCADGSITYTKTREDVLLGVRPEIYSADITVTTDARGIAEVSRGNLPIGFMNCPYVVTFFNGSSEGYKYYFQITDYNGNPIANQKVSMTVIYIPNILDIMQHQSM